ncbi:MAG: amidohydrolase family protein [Rhodoferax sp.]|nr:amidohydrolase family protein [Rhodoferax sp.]
MSAPSGLAQQVPSVRPLGQAPCDLVIEQGRIRAVLPAGRAPADLPVLVDGAGRLLLPPLVDAHQHLDKTLWGLPWRPNSAGPTRNDRIRNETDLLRDFPVPVADRASGLIRQCVAQGTLRIRSHVDIQTAWGLRHATAMLALREAWRDIIELQLVAFPQAGMRISPGTEDLMREALALGVDVVGGIDPAAIDRDPIRHLEAVFDMARSFGRGVDIHLHDPGDLGRWEIERIADFTESHGLAGRVMISHAYCLGSFSTDELAPLTRRLSGLGIAIMSCAPSHVSVPPLKWLRSQGVTCCSGSDGIRDAWSPMGSGDMLERAKFIAMRFGWSRDEDLAAALDIVTAGGSQAMGLPPQGLAAGDAASFVLLDAETPGEAVVRHPGHRTVVSRGRLVAQAGRYCGPDPGH